MSPDLYTHSVSYFAEAPLTLFSPSELRVFVYDATQRPDARSAHIQERAVRAGATWRPCAALTEDALAKAIRADEVDILVELSGHTAFNKLGCLAKRPAPIQARRGGAFCALFSLSLGFNIALAFAFDARALESYARARARSRRPLLTPFSPARHTRWAPR